MTKPIFKTFFSIIIICFFVFFFAGLFNYKEKILATKEYSSIKASNIVILTGGSNRIREGLKIINNFDNSTIMNIKLLISGTGKGFTKSNVIKLLPKIKNLNMFIKCCVKLDSESQNTYSNAIETLKWAQKNNIKDFILITSNYHMPRAILEFKTLMPNFDIVIHPISPKRHNINDWMGSFETFSLISIEYIKFLIAKSRINIMNIHNF